MNYYSHHIGDYLSATAHLSLLEHGAYRRLIDVYYIHEQPLPGEKAKVYRLVGARTKEDKEAVDVVLAEFFEFRDGMFHQDRCDHEIALCNKNRNNGKKGGRKAKTSDNGFSDTNPNGTQTEPKPNPNKTQDESPPSPHHPITPSPGKNNLSEQAAAATDSLVDNSVAGVLPAAADFDARAKTLADRLTKWLKDGGYAIRVTPKDERLREWVRLGLTDPDLREAWDRADQRRRDQDSQAPINVGFLNAFVLEILAEGGARSPPEAQAKACCVCGQPWTHKVGSEYYCQNHDQHSERKAA